MLPRPSAALSILAALLAVAASGAVAAQPARTIPVGDPAYTAIERLQRRGLLLELHPTALPYTEAEVSAALAALEGTALDERPAEWVRLLRRRLPVGVAGPGEIAIRATLGTAPHASTSARMDPLRPAPGTALAPSFRIGDGGFWTQADLRVAIGAGPLVAQLGVMHSLYANDDPDGLDVVNRAMMRNEEGYVAYRSPLVDVALGRIATQWGSAGRDALVLSDNPHPFDAIHLRIGGPRLAVRSLLGQLDTALPDGTFSDVVNDRPGDQPNDRVRIDRFVGAHRFDWRPSRALALTIMESAVYSGVNADPSLAYLLPTQVFSFLVDNTPKNVQNNGLVGGMLWGQWRAWTLQGQLMVDDFDFVGGTEPASAALMGSLVRADVVPNVDAEVSLTAVTARAYNTDQREGIYTFALRGIGTEFSDYVRLGIRADWFAARGVTLSPGAQALWQGERSLESPYPSNDVATILTGDVQRTLRLALGLAYQTDARWWAHTNVGVNLSSDPISRGFQGVVTVGARLGLAGTVRADL